MCLGRTETLFTYSSVTTFPLYATVIAQVMWIELDNCMLSGVPTLSVYKFKLFLYKYLEEALIQT